MKRSRSILMAMAGLGAALVLAACGSEGGGAAGATAPW